MLLTGCDPNCGADTYANIAQIYDPVTDTFSSTGSTGAAYGLTQTLLTNGQVLFAGGESDNGYPYASAQFFDPCAGVFSPTGDMSKARDLHTASLLPDGTVLIAGGRLDIYGPSPCCVSHQTAESYDPDAGAFGSASSMAVGRGDHTATLLLDGRVLLAGGITFDSRSQRIAPPNILASAEIYTPAVVVAAPALFLFPGDAPLQGAIWHADSGQIASSDNAAVAGESLSLYTTSVADGSVISPQVVVGGALAQVLNFGAAPGYQGTRW